MTEDELAYFTDVASKYADGHHTSSVTFDRAQVAKCHENADLFFEQFPNCEVVRGWLLSEIGGAPGVFRIVAHSLNRTPDGNLVDATPLSEADRKAYRFITHNGTDDQFTLLRNKYPELYFPPIDPFAVSGLGFR
jgi:hypothetical protein